MPTELPSLPGHRQLLRPLVFARPLRLVEPTSWVPHIPFAFWLIEALRPATVVELGTMSGNSFTAFAQAVQTLGLASACYAVDTWKGDPHSGHYPEDVFREWSAFHDRNFGAFSRLVRSTFDEARAQFPDGGIDLLHIDGIHTYEAVRHDFETWLPKLSPRAVVLFHDINVRELDFGVWRFWEELTAHYPTFAFLHGHGLGVAAVGRELSDDVALLVGEVARSTSDTALVRQFFGTLGEGLLRQSQEGAYAGVAKEASRLTDERNQLSALVADRDAALRSTQAEISALSAERDRLAAERLQLLGEREQMRLATAAEQEQRSRVEAQVAEIEARLQHQSARQSEQASELFQARQDLRTELERERLRTRASLQRLSHEAGRPFALLAAIRTSHESKLLAPVRRISALVRAHVHRNRIRARLGRGPRSPLGFLYPSLLAQARLVSRGGMFDPAYYLRQVATSANQADLAAAWKAPLMHYLSVGAFVGFDPHPLFDTAFYFQRNPDIATQGIEPLTHYLRFGGFEGRDPHPLFESGFYLEHNPDVAADRSNPLVHFLLHGGREGRDPSPWFDASFYLDAVPEARQTGENPLLHYLRVGGAEGRPVGAAFDTAHYLRQNPDVAAQGMNPLVHFLIAGQQEGRSPRPDVLATPGNSSGLPQPGDMQASSEAYDRVSKRARQAEAARIGDLSVSAPTMIRVADRDELRSVARTVTLPTVADPLVSIVIPIIDGLRFTLECLLSLSRFTTKTPYEVIVVDNGSTDGSEAILPSIPNLKYARQEHNIEFGPGCNAGAALASGQYLVFLNNDAQVHDGWAEALLAPFSNESDVGAVGPKVLFPDGRLQDAGSAVNPDCTSTMVGVFDDPALPRYNYRRDVAYLSAVCVMIETARFRALGGFDAAFAPAYCEDVDLCLRLAAQGLRLIYEPAATVVHHLSATSNSLGASFKMATVTNHQQKLAERHQAQIDRMNEPRLLAFYLPQYHPIPENDVWWGKGFTEWRNVARGRPIFPGHYQPRLAGDLGFYDLRLRDTYAQQVALARRYGIDGFCFYYYWFDGKRLLERPLERMLEDASIDFPFCVCWANENWTRRWDGMEHEVLMAQAHGPEDDRAVIADLVRYLQHPAYIKVKGRPLVLVYNATLFPDIAATLAIWREECRARGLGEIYVAMVESFDLAHQKATPESLGFDAGVEFPPHHGGVHPVQGLATNPQFRGQVFSYELTATHYLTKSPPGYRCFRGVIPGWDNTARRMDQAVVFAGSTPGAFQAWLEGTLRQAREQHVGDEQLVFINAWNEWAEGAYLEPDLGWGHGYLEAVRNARDNVRLGLR